MRKQWTVGLITVAAATLVVQLSAPEPVELIERLAARRATDRDAAARELLAAGRTALPALEDAARGGDTAIRDRAQALADLVREGTGAGSAARHAAATSLVRTALREPGGLDPAGPYDAQLAALRQECAPLLADAALRAGRTRLVRADLAVALGRHSTTQSVDALCRLVRADRVQPSAALRAARELERLPTAAVPATDTITALLDETLRERSGPLRRAAVAIRGALAQDDLGAVAASAGDDHPGVRSEVARALGRSGRLAHATVLRRLAEDSDADVRLAALRALQYVPGAPEPGPAVINADHPDASVRAAAAALLARDATPDSLDVLTRLTTDDSPRVRREATQALQAHHRPDVSRNF